MKFIRLTRTGLFIAAFALSSSTAIANVALNFAEQNVEFDLTGGVTSVEGTLPDGSPSGITLTIDEPTMTMVHPNGETYWIINDDVAPGTDKDLGFSFAATLPDGTEGCVFNALELDVENEKTTPGSVNIGLYNGIGISPPPGEDSGAGALGTTNAASSFQGGDLNADGASGNAFTMSLFGGNNSFNNEGTGYDGFVYIAGFTLTAGSAECACVPEPSSFLFLSLVAILGSGRRRFIGYFKSRN